MKLIGKSNIFSLLESFLLIFYDFLLTQCVDSGVVLSFVNFYEMFSTILVLYRCLLLLTRLKNLFQPLYCDSFGLWGKKLCGLTFKYLYFFKRFV